MLHGAVAVDRNIARPSLFTIGFVGMQSVIGAVHRLSSTPTTRLTEVASYLEPGTTITCATGRRIWRFRFNNDLIGFICGTAFRNMTF